VLGDEEVTGNTVLIESRDGDKLGVLPLSEFISRIRKEEKH